MQNPLISPVCLRSACSEQQDRRASWMELFYDLVFVVAVSAIADRLYHHLNFSGLWQFGLLFLALWGAWTVNTFYATRFDTDDAYHRFMFFAQMFCIAMVALFAEHAFTTHARYLAMAYSSLGLIILILYVRVVNSLEEIRTIFLRLLMGLGISTLLWVSSIFVPNPYRFMLWAVALGIYFVTPWALNKTFSGTEAAVFTEHLPERFGLFTIIVLGEAVANVIHGLEVHGVTGLVLMSAILSLVLAFGIWWAYFENLDTKLEGFTHHIVLKWEFAHLFLVFGITLLSISIRVMIEAQGSLSFLQANCLGIALVFIILSLNIIHNIVYRCTRLHGVYCSLAAYALALGCTVFNPAIGMLGFCLLIGVMI